MQGTPPPPPSPPTVFFLPGHISGPSIQNRKFFCSRVSLSTLVGRSRNKSFDETASFWQNFDFSSFLGFLGVWALVFLSGTPKRPKMPKNRIWGPGEAISAKFSGNLKVAHGDSATDEPKKSGF